MARTPIPAAASPANPPAVDARTLALTGGMGAPPAARPAAPQQDATPGRDAPATAANATTDAYSVSLGTMMAIKDRIAESAPWISNPLNEYQTYTYHFRLFMVQDYDYMTSLNAGDQEGEIKPGDVFRAIDNNPMRVIAESGVTTGFNIQEVKIESLVGPNMETQNTNATNFIIEILEPLGTSLVETMRNAAVDLGIRNMDKCPYFLELTFMGYDENADAVSQVDPGNPNVTSAALLTEEYDNGGRWLYQIKITNIETELTASGSNYTVTALPYNEDAFDPSVGCSPALLSVSGTTIREFLDSLKESLTKQWLYYHFIKDVYTFDFVVHTRDSNDNPENYQLISPDPTLEENRNDRWDDGLSVPTMSVPLGMEISSIIEAAFANTREAKSRALSVLLQAEEAMSSEDAATAQQNRSGLTSVALYRAAKLFRIEPDIEIIGYNYYSNIYRKHITFHIWPFFTQAPVISRTLASEARRPEVQSRLFHELIDRGFFRKKYDYIFTGNNTEVTRLDIRHNLAWSAVLPVLKDFYTSTEDTVTHARRAEDAPAAPAPAASTDADAPRPPPSGTPTGQRGVEAGQQLQRDLARLGEKQRELAQLPEDDPRRTTIQEEIDRINIDIVDATEELRYNRDAVKDYAARNVAMEAEANSQRRRGADKKYLEDLDEPIPYTGAGDNLEPLPHTISFSRPHSQTANMTGQGFASPVGGERGVYGAILEQMYGPLTTGLINIDLEIRGDPYWLSHSNVERRLHFLGTPPPLTSAANMAAYMEGDNVFMLEFSYPFNVDAESGDINIRQTVGVDQQGRLNVDRIDKFTGLYRVVRATHTFSGGEFRQTLKAQRFPLLDLARAMQFTGTHSADTLTAAATTRGEAAREATNAAPASSGGGGGPAAGGGGGARVPNNQAALAASLDPRMARVVARAQEIDAQNGGGFRIGGEGGRRTRDQQAQIVGRNNSRVMNSRHLTGQAVDVLPVDSQGRAVSGWESGTHPAYARISRSMAQASRELGIPILWGGNFSDPANAADERSHYELRRSR